MYEIKPFKGVHYSKTAGNIGDLITQPYDKITPQMQEDYYKQHENNAIRIELAKDMPGDSDTSNKYTRANEMFQKWLASGVLERDGKDTIYAYNQEYIHPETQKIVVRRSFIALSKLYDYSENVIYPHEHTLSGPKMDRLMLTRATKTNLGLCLFFYRDQQDAINKLLDTHTKGEPLFDAVDNYKTHHKIWKIDDPAEIKKIQDMIGSKAIIIADGHHRYETALNYRNEMKEKNPGATGDEVWNYRMAAYINMSDPGLYVFPTHRLIRNVPNFNFDAMLGKIKEKFNVTELPIGCCLNSGSKELEAKMRENMDKHALGLMAKDKNVMYLLTLKDEKLAHDIPVKMSNDWKTLDVSILHKLILEPILGIDDAKLAAQTNVDYERYTEDAVKPLTEGKYQCVFLMNYTPTKAVEDVTKHHETMPQKSTDYFPKVQSGLVIQYMPDGEKI